MIVLTTIVPPLVCVLRPYYSQKIIRPPLAGEDMSNSEELVLETSDHLDVHLTFVSCVIAAISYLYAAASTTNLTLILCKCSVALLSAPLLIRMIQLPSLSDLPRYVVLRRIASSLDLLIHSSKVRLLVSHTRHGH